ncbi:outer membrane protein assembly factor, partial [Aromatoleum toluclasticum]|nr:outer membrane protein assembly factor [Aromatoleum toluclasticum]
QGTLQNEPQYASVVVDVERDPALAAAGPVRVQVSEARSRQLGFVTGYSSNTGFRGEVSWRVVNLFGRGWELASALRVEQLRQSLFADVFLPPS